MHTRTHKNIWLFKRDLELKTRYTPDVTCHDGTRVRLWSPRRPTCLRAILFFDDDDDDDGEFTATALSTDARKRRRQASCLVEWNFVYQRRAKLEHVLGRGGSSNCKVFSFPSTEVWKNCKIVNSLHKWGKLTYRAIAWSSKQQKVWFRNFN